MKKEKIHQGIGMLKFLLLAVCCTMFFSVIEVGKMYLLEEGIEEYIDKSEFVNREGKKNKGRMIQSKKGSKEEYLSAQELLIEFIPEDFTFNNHLLLSSMIHEKIFGIFTKKLTLSFHEERSDVRGKMLNRTIKIFGPQHMKNPELLAVFMHEFGHYIDIYFFKKGLKGDISNKFYKISWDSTKVMRAGQKTEDFVSGYAMTNKYEDFAETYVYYIFHNEDFLIKAGESKVLLEKYNFIKIAIFRGGNFQDTDFYNDGSKENIIGKYNRDVTKIPFSTKNFLQYLKKKV